MKEAAVASQSCHVFEGPSDLFPGLSEEQVRFRREHYQRHRDWKRGLIEEEEFNRSRRRWTAIRRSYRRQLIVYRHREGLKHESLVTHMEHAKSKYEDEEMRILNNSCLEELRVRADWAASVGSSGPRECPISMA
eukprot:2574785-Pyramimonas_sp.AAC.1